jgi:hypothetical protein
LARLAAYRAGIRTARYFCLAGSARRRSLIMWLAVMPQDSEAIGMPLPELTSFRREFHACLTSLGDAPLRLPLPRAADGRIVLAVDVSPWLRSEAVTGAGRPFCHTYGRGEGKHQMVPRLAVLTLAALEPGRSSWIVVLDAARLGPGEDVAAATTGQVRAAVERLVAAGQWRPGDFDVMVVLDAGYDVPRIAHLPADLPVEVLGRMRSDRVLRCPAPPYARQVKRQGQHWTTYPALFGARHRCGRGRGGDGAAPKPIWPPLPRDSPTPVLPFSNICPRSILRTPLSGPAHASGAPWGRFFTRSAACSGAYQAVRR